MAYMTYEQQIEEHVRRLRELGLDVTHETLKIVGEDDDPVRCRKIKETL